MNLVIDFGNSYTKVGIFDHNNLKNVIIINKDDFHKITNLFPNYKIDAVIISSVIDTPLDLFAKFQKVCNKIILFDKSTKTPLLNKYKSPESLGNDRLALATGSRMLFKNKNALIIDAGSCITYDFVTLNGEYIGGAISPGIEMRLKALNTFTDKLPLIKQDKYQPLIGKNTRESILSGVQNGVIFEINSVLDYYKAQYNPLKIIITGGDAIFLSKKIKSRIFVEPNFLLISLNQILLYNE